TLDSHGGSLVGATSLAQIAQRLIGQFIQSARGDIALELTIPGSRVEFREPSAQRNQLFLRKLADSVFDFADSAHETSISHLAAYEIASRTSCRVSRGYDSSNCSTDSPAPIRSRINSTVIRVPATTGLPTIMLGFDSIMRLL